jgi:predicted nucleic acid-binding Zn ribbon protein
VSTAGRGSKSGRWRPLPGQSGQPDPRPVGESLDGLAKRLGAARPAVLTGVFGHWEALVGAGIAAHARPLSLSQGVLVIGTDQPAWATQLRFLGPDLLERLSAVGGQGEIQRIDIKVVPPKGS